VKATRNPPYLPLDIGSQNRLKMLIEDVVHLRAYRGMQVLGRDLMIQVTRRGQPSRRDRSTEFVVTIGRPNFAARRLIERAHQGDWGIGGDLAPVFRHTFPKRKERKS